MSEQNEISESDRRLLEEIEQIALNGDVERQEEDSLYGFCAHLASTVPQAGQDYQQRLDAQLADRWRKAYGVQLDKDPESRYGHFQAWSRYHPQRCPSYHPAALIGRIFSRRTALAWAGLVVLFITLVSLIFVPTVRVFADQFIREVILGDFSSVKQIELEPKDEVPVTTDNRWTIETVLGGSGGEMPAGADPTIQSFESIQEAQKYTSLPIKEPGYLPEGYALREVKLPPGSASEDVAFLFYEDPGQEIVFSMVRVGEQPGEAPGLAMVKVSVIATNGSVEELKVGDHPAAWIDGKALAWEADDILYEVGGSDLSLDVAVRIAESIP